MSHSDGKLDPCPFCGSAAKLENLSKPEHERHITAGCSNENCFAYLPSVYFAREADAIAAWNRRTPPAGAGEVVVKPLEWREEGDEDDVWALVALGLSCRYEVFHRASDVAKIGVQVARSVPTEDGGQNADILGYGKTVAEAKAIAQADYEQRLVSAIELSGNSGGLPVALSTRSAP